MIRDLAQKWVNYNLSRSLWFYPVYTGCCGDEISQTWSCRYDFERFGLKRIQTPKSADLLIVSGFVNEKLLPHVIEAYEKMSAPRYVMAFGSCACSGGVFKKKNLGGIDRALPVDVYVPGNPPRPEAFMHGILALQEKIRTELKR